MSAWQTTNKGLAKEFKFRDFKDAMLFVENVGRLAEESSHHPDISFGWGYARITLFSHDQQAITKRDRDLAAKIDKISD